MTLFPTLSKVTAALAFGLLFTSPLTRPALADEPAHFTFTSWTTRDGLSSSYLLSLAQDRDGYLWVGTQAGLVRFDGQRFSTWPRAGAFPSPNPLINAILPARDGSLWVVAGTHVIRERDGQLTVFAPGNGVPQATRILIESHDGTIWAGGTGGLARFRGDTWQMVEITDAAGAVVNALHEDDQRHLWVSTAGRIYRQEGERFVRMPAVVEGAVRFVEREGTMLVASATSRLNVLGLEGAARSTSLVSLPLTDGNAPYAWGRASWRDQALPALLDSRGNLWLGTNGAGLLRIDVSQGRVISRYTERDGLSGDLVRALLEDRDGNIWVATHSGLTRVTRSSIRSVAVRSESTAEDISTLEADSSGGVWVEAPGALVHVADGTRTVFTEGAGAQFDRITAMHTDLHNVLWVATGDGRVVRHVGGRFEAVALPRDFGEAPVSAIASHPDGRVWMYNGRQLLAMHPEGGGTDVSRQPQAITGPIRFLFADSRGRLWMAADNARIGLLEGGAFRMFTSAHGVPAGTPYGIHEDRTGRIWIAGDGGLSTLQDERFVTLTMANGLPRNRLFFVTGDDHGRIWLGTSSGLVRVEREELKESLADPHHQMRLQLFDVSDGLRGTPVVRGYPTAARNRDGIWFVTSTGVALIDPANVRDAFPPPVPRIEQVLVDGQSFTVSPDSRLPRDVASLQIEYAALNLTAPTKVRFRHRLDGVDAGWVDDGDTRRTVYAHLPSGTYRFNVAATGGDGRWTGDAAVWTFVIPPQWYTTNLFYGASAAVLILGIWGSYQLRVRQINRRFTDVLRERARVAREIHDTLLQNLVGMALQLDTVARTEDTSGLRDEVSRIRLQVQESIAEAQQSIRDLRSPRTELRDLVTRLRDSAGPMLEQAGIDFDLNITGTPRPLETHVEQQLLRIGTEAVVNAMRHAEASHVRMELAYERSNVRLKVTDDGHGFNPDAVTRDDGGHWGLSIMRERAEQVGGRFSVASQPQHGTIIEVVAPGGTPA
ncbi:MAG: two-component regulator propeller domain-containing protein [Vicinamibacterales bacterium]